MCWVVLGKQRSAHQIAVTAAHVMIPVLLLARRPGHRRCATTAARRPPHHFAAAGSEQRYRPRHWRWRWVHWRRCIITAAGHFGRTAGTGRTPTALLADQGDKVREGVLAPGGVVVVVLGVEGGGGGGGWVPGVTLRRAVVQVLRGQACNKKKWIKF